MFNEKEIQKEVNAMRSEISELGDILRRSEETRNAQYTDLMMAFNNLTAAIEAQTEEYKDFKSLELDDLYEDVRDYVVKQQQASESSIQERFKLSYERAAHLVDQLEEQEVISPSDGTNKPRKVLVKE